MPKKKTSGPTDEDLFALLAKTIREKDPEAGVFYGEANKERQKSGIYSIRETGVSGHIPTGLTLLDAALNGGIAMGRLTELFGGSSDGKTALLKVIIAFFQRMGGKVLHFDQEKSFDPEMAKALGVNLGKGLIVTRVPYTEKFFEDSDRALHSMSTVTSPLLITLDSMPTLIPKKFLEDPSYEQNDTYYRARVISQCLAKFSAVLNRTSGTIVMVNQVRNRVEHNKYKAKFIKEEDKVVATGGQARDFAMTTRIQLLRKAQIIVKKGEGRKLSIGIRGEIYVAKNKEGEPFAKFPYYYYFKNIGRFRVGFADQESTLAYLKNCGLVKDGTKKAEGKEKADKVCKILFKDGSLEQPSFDALVDFLQVPENKPIWADVQEYAKTILLGRDIPADGVVAEEETDETEESLEKTSEATVEDTE